MPENPPAPGAVFLSYASQDAEAAKRICEALRAAGVEVWFDQSELVGGDAWDQKIRKQIKECALLIPIISAATEARAEGYFRLEWRLADQRTHLMGKTKSFLMPITIDATRESEADVPESFIAVQWTKAPGGQVPPAFVARVRKLLDRGPGSGEAVSRTADPASRELGPPRSISPRWLAPVLAGGVLCLLALIFSRPWAKAPPASGLPPAVSPLDSARGLSLSNGQSNPSPDSAAPAARPSEARQLVAKAWVQLNKPDASRSELEVADDFCKRAAALDPTDADVWAAWSQVDSLYVFDNNIDATPARRESARSKAARALQLSAESYEARLAQACYLVRGGDNLTVSLFPAEADTLLRKLLQEQPEEPRALYALGILSRITGKIDEARMIFGRLAKQPAFAAQALSELGWTEYLYTGDYRAAELAADASIAREPILGNLTLKLLLALYWRGDLALAKATLDRIPAARQQEDFAASLAAELHYVRRDPESLLRVVGGVSRDWLRSNSFDGPKAWWSGVAHQIAGRSEPAQLQWRTALNLVERRLAEQPDSAALLRWKGRLLAVTGDLKGAETTLRLADGTSSQGPDGWWWSVTDQILLGKLDTAMTLLEQAADQRALGMSLANCQVNPNWDALREQPRFKALLARLAADPKMSSKAAAPKPQTPDPEPSGPSPADAKSVAVLPFANLSGDKEQEYFSDGLTEEVLGALRRERDLTVPGNTSCFSFRGKNVSAQEIAGALHVSRLVEGSVQRVGSRVRIRVTLSRPADNSSEELGTFTEELTDIFALQEKVARAVVAKLTRRTTTAPVAVLTKNTEAYDAFLRGRALMTRGLNVEAIKLLEQAVALDPVFALAWTSLAEAKFASYSHGRNRSSEQAAEARGLIDRALGLQPDLPEALIARADWERNVQADYAAAQRDLARAEALQPATAELRYQQAFVARDLGQWDEAFRFSREMVQLDPNKADYIFGHATQIFWRKGAYAETDRLLARADALVRYSTERVTLRLIWRGPAAALRLLDRAGAGTANRKILRLDLLLAMDRQNEARALATEAESDALGIPTAGTEPDRFRAGMMLSRLLAFGREDAARRLAAEVSARTSKELERGNRSSTPRGEFIRAEIVLGHRDTAFATLEQWRRENQLVQNNYQRVALAAYLPYLYALLGKADEAIAVLREYAASGLQFPFSLRYDLDFALIRSDPRFQELMQQQDAWAQAQPDPVDL